MSTNVKFSFLHDNKRRN